MKKHKKIKKVLSIGLSLCVVVTMAAPINVSAANISEVTVQDSDFKDGKHKVLDRKIDDMTITHNKDRDAKEILTNVKLGSLLVKGKSPRTTTVKFNDTTINSTTAKKDVKFVSGTGDNKMKTLDVDAVDCAVTSNIDTGTVTVESERTTVKLSGEVDSVSVEKEAEKSRVIANGNAKVSDIILKAEDSAFKASQQAEVETVTATQNASGAMISTGENSTVTNLINNAPKATSIINGTVTNVDIGKSATGSVTTTGGNSTIDTLNNKASDSNLTIQGTVDNVNLTNSAGGSTVKITATADVNSFATGAGDSTTTVEGTVENVTVKPKAEGADVSVAESGEVQLFKANATILVSVEGKVENLTVGKKAEEVTVEASETGTIASATINGGNATISTANDIKTLTTASNATATVNQIPVASNTTATAVVTASTNNDGNKQTNTNLVTSSNGIKTESNGTMTTTSTGTEYNVETTKYDSNGEKTESSITEGSITSTVGGGTQNVATTTTTTYTKDENGELQENPPETVTTTTDRDKDGTITGSNTVQGGRDPIENPGGDQDNNYKPDDNTTGGDQSGDNTTGGDQSGDNTTGGDQSGDNTTGGDQSGDNTTGGDQSGDNTTGGDQSGDNTTGGDQNTTTTYTVTYRSDGSTYTTQSATSENNYTITAPSTPSIAGYTFNGWYTEAGTQVTFPLTVSSDITLTARWLTNYTVTYRSDGSTYATQTVANGRSTYAPTAPAREGYAFVGWYADAALTTRVTFPMSVSGNTTLYAGWTVGNGSAEASVQIGENVALFYTSLEEAVDAANKADSAVTITLRDDITVKDTIEFSGNSNMITLNLNGNDITSEKEVIRVGNGTATGKVAITGTGTIARTTDTGNVIALYKNSTLDLGGTSAGVVTVYYSNEATNNPAQGAVAVYGGSLETVLTVNRATITDTTYGITPFGACTVNIYEGATIESTTEKDGDPNAAISGNGSNGAGGTVINVYGGIIRGGDYNVGIYQPQTGTLNIEGGEISGIAGLDIKAGTVTVSGGEITGTALSAQNVDAAIYRGISGANAKAGAITVIQKAGYSVGTDEIKVEVTGGTIEGDILKVTESVNGNHTYNVTTSVPDTSVVELQ
jgi:uncharacterized repeat protein (TIGR02543 family)